MGIMFGAASMHKKSLINSIFFILSLFPVLAKAVPVVGPENMSFYSPPPILSGEPGELIWYRSANVILGSDAPAFSAWNLLFYSTDAIGETNVASGTLIIPSDSWVGEISRPIISYAPGTHGMAQQCAPSLQMAIGNDYETAIYIDILKQGYVLLISDNPGYTNDAEYPSYMVGKAQAHAAMDIVSAAAEFTGGIDAAAPLAIWGYSQGGQTAAWAGELHSTYAPHLNLTAIATGGTPANFIESSHYLNGGVGASFLLSAIVGMNQQYPQQFPIEEFANEEAYAAIERADGECVFSTLFDLMNDDFSLYTIGSVSLETLLDQLPATRDVLNQQNLGSNNIDVPVYLYHGLADEFIPIEQSFNLKQEYCGRGSSVTYELYPSEHIVTLFQASDNVLSWIKGRFDGEPSAGNCFSQEQTPVSTAEPKGANFIVTLDEWILDAGIKLKTLRQSISLPTGSFFTAESDLNEKTIITSMDVPDFLAKIWVILPFDIKLAVTTPESVTGSMDLDENGILSASSLAPVEMTVVSAGFGSFQIPFGCRTSEPVLFPLEFEGPVSNLGNGGLEFVGTTTFPSLTGCGIFSGLFSLLMSGSGQEFSLRVIPPSPALY